MFYGIRAALALVGSTNRFCRSLTAFLLACALLASPTWAAGNEASADLFPTLAAVPPVLEGGTPVREPEPIAPYGSIYGWVWEDLNQNELWDEDEPALTGWTVFLDRNENARLDGDDTSTQSDGEGYYRLDGIVSGTHTLGVVVQDGWYQTWPRAPLQAHSIEVVAGESHQTYFGNTRQSPPSPSPPVAAPAPDSVLSMRSSSKVEYPLLHCGRLDTIGKSITQTKECMKLPVTLGAWHWWHVNTGGPFPDGYGIPDLSGTYAYYLQVEPEWEVDWGKVTQTGVYLDLRFRDGGDPFRPFYSSSAAWFDTAYAWALTDHGLFKAGSVWKRFGLDWDGTWWGPVQYFDGYKLDTDWGVSWEDTPEMECGFKIDKYLQFFIHENNVNGSLVGADPESVIGSSEKNTFVVRLVPTWELCPHRTLALGVSALVGQIENEPFVRLTNGFFAYPTNDDEVHAAWALDLTFATKDLKVYGEILQSYGTRSPARYTSGGASNRQTAALAGLQYTCGPLTSRFNYSVALDDNPAATQHLFVPSVTLALTSNVDLQVEYVRQHVQGNAFLPMIEMEDGLQFLVHWRF